MKLKYLVLPALILGIAIGYFSNNLGTKETKSCPHFYSQWKSSGQLGGLTRSKLIMERRCFTCGKIESKTSD